MREETRISKGLWLVQDLFSGNGEQGINPRNYKKQLVTHTWIPLEIPKVQEFLSGHKNNQRIKQISNGMDPLVDMFNRIKNALAVGKEQVEVPHSKMRFEIAKILERLGYVKSAESKGRKTKRSIEVVLKYHEKTPAITGLRRISKQGQRIYASAFQVFRLKKRNAIAIFSTSKGLMTDGEAREQKIGGEVLCEVWG